MADLSSVELDQMAAWTECHAYPRKVAGEETPHLAATGMLLAARQTLVNKKSPICKISSDGATAKRGLPEVPGE
jgi:hypothetical protein